MDQRHEREPHTSFEVTFPSDAAYHEYALRGLGNVFGWVVRERRRTELEARSGTPDAQPAPLSSLAEDEERAAIPILVAERISAAQETPVTLGDLKNVSSSLFDAPSYGETAHSILEHERVRYAGMLIVPREEQAYFEQAYWYSTSKLHYVTHRGAGPAAIELRARQEINAMKPPFTFEFSSAKEDKHRATHLIPTHVTQEHLAGFVRERGYHTHELHGQIGKSLDVLNVSAHAAPSRVPPEFDAGPMVQLTDVVRVAKERGLSGHAVKVVFETVMEALARQARTGRPLEEYGGEIIAEGHYDVTEGYYRRRTVLGLTIAVQSLVRLGASRNQNSKGAVFLQHLPEYL